MKECSDKDLTALSPMFCKLAKNSAVEKEAVDEICSNQQKVPAADCEVGLSKLWQMLANKECPNKDLTALPPMFCKLIESEAIEKNAVDGICSEQQKVPAAECEAGLSMAWEMLAKKECPSSV